MATKKRTMTVHEGLAKIKLYESRINKSIKTLEVMNIKKASLNKTVDGHDVDNFTKKVKADYQSILDLIEERNKIKRAITLSNAMTKVNIGGVEYTVAEAIDMKYAIEFKNNLLDRVQLKVLSFTTERLKKNDKVHKESIEMASQLLGGEKTNKDVIEKAEEFEARQTFELVDPLNATKVIEELDKFIDEFNSNVDFELSKSNALTVIEIEN